MSIENNNSRQRRQEAGKRYIESFKKLGAPNEYIEATQRAMNGPTYEERQRLIRTGKLRRKATFFERLSHRVKRLG